MASGKRPKAPEVAPGGAARVSPREVKRTTAEAGAKARPAHVPDAAVDTPVASAKDSTVAFAFRLKNSTLASLMAQAEERQLTQKQIICMGLQMMGVDVAAVDLEDRTPRRKLS